MTCIGVNNGLLDSQVGFSMKSIIPEQPIAILTVSVFPARVTMTIPSGNQMNGEMNNSRLKKKKKKKPRAVKRGSLVFLSCEPRVTMDLY
jgi:hypothetical protein